MNPSPSFQKLVGGNEMINCGNQMISPVQGMISAMGDQFFESANS
jgi:hypothetical protein